MKCVSLPVCLLCWWVKNVETVERKGERQFALCPFQPSLFVCRLRPPLLLVPSFSRCQSTLSFCQFVFHLKITHCCFSNFQIAVCHHFDFMYCLSSFVLFSIFIVFIFIIQPSECFIFIFFVVTGETGNHSHCAHKQFPNTHSSLVAELYTQEWVISCKIFPKYLHLSSWLLQTQTAFNQPALSCCYEGGQCAF